MSKVRKLLYQLADCKTLTKDWGKHLNDEEFEMLQRSLNRFNETLARACERNENEKAQLSRRTI